MYLPRTLQLQGIIELGDCLGTVRSTFLRSGIFSCRTQLSFALGKWPLAEACQSVLNVDLASIPIAILRRMLSVCVCVA